MEGRSCFPLDNIDNLVKSVRNTMGCTEAKELQTTQETVCGANRKRRVFPVIPAIKALVKKEWEKQDQRGYLPSASKRRYPFSDEGLSSWSKVPKVDAAVASASKRLALPVEDAGVLKDPLDQKADGSLKRAWEAATGTFKPAIASTCTARSMLVWIDQLDQQIDQKISRDKLRAAIPLIRGAAAYIADASADSLRMAARTARLVNNARRSLWLKSWRSDTQSKAKLCAIPCEGEFLFGKALDEILTKAKERGKKGSLTPLSHFMGLGDDHLVEGDQQKIKIAGPRRKKKAKVPCLEDPPSAGTRAKEPDPPEGGRLKNFLQEWEKVTANPWVLGIVREGLKIEFHHVPRNSVIITSFCSQIQQRALEAEILSVLDKKVLVHVPKGQEGRVFYSPPFLIPKPDT
ncbi:uncharacterized protein [Dendrobates tinctorius]|uniref:uncharacterized protein n=1 Tax=Dendrobates tinctorius TaxID=92724 RepID=UPI003CC9F14A